MVTWSSLIQVSSLSLPWVVFTGTALQLVAGRGGNICVARGALGMVVQLDGLFWVLRIRLSPGQWVGKFELFFFWISSTSIPNLTKKQWKPSPRTFLWNFFECFMWGGFTNTRPANWELVACCPSARGFDWMLCNALGWALRGEDSLH